MRQGRPSSEHKLIYLQAWRVLAQARCSHQICYTYTTCLPWITLPQQKGTRHAILRPPTASSTLPEVILARDFVLQVLDERVHCDAHGPHASPKRDVLVAAFRMFYMHPTCISICKAVLRLVSLDPKTPNVAARKHTHFSW